MQPEEWGRYPFFSLGANTRASSSAFISNLGQVEKSFSTFAPIEMLDLI
jgi:hypothetical protein